MLLHIVHTVLFFAGLLAIAMIPLIAIAGIVQMAMFTGEYGDKDVSFTNFKSRLTNGSLFSSIPMDAPVTQAIIVPPLKPRSCSLANTANV